MTAATPITGRRRMRGFASVSAQPAMGLAGLAGATLMVCLLHLKLGIHDVGWTDLWSVITRFDRSDPTHAVIGEFRLPRMLIALAVGAASGAAGALIQGMTGNPVAAPDILGVNAGAMLAVVVASAGFGIGDPRLLVWTAFAGAALSGTVVYGLGTIGPSGGTPARLVLAGAAMAALLSALAMAVLILSNETFGQIRFWLAGSTTGGTLATFAAVLPYLLIGMILAVLLAGPTGTLALGGDIARGLGQNVSLIRLGVACTVVLLAGASVAIAGPIGFIGLIAPHMARFVIGGDYRWLVPCAALLGGILLLSADLLGRTVLAPRDIPAGIVTAFLGAPVFIALVRRRLA